MNLPNFFGFSNKKPIVNNNPPTLSVIPGYGYGFDPNYPDIFGCTLTWLSTITNNGDLSLWMSMLPSNGWAEVGINIPSDVNQVSIPYLISRSADDGIRVFVIRDTLGNDLTDKIYMYKQQDSNITVSNKAPLEPPINFQPININSGYNFTCGASWSNVSTTATSLQIMSTDSLDGANIFNVSNAFTPNITTYNAEYGAYLGLGGTAPDGLVAQYYIVTLNEDGIPSIPSNKITITKVSNFNFTIT